MGNKYDHQICYLAMLKYFQTLTDIRKIDASYCMANGYNRIAVKMYDHNWHIQFLRICYLQHHVQNIF